MARTRCSVWKLEFSRKSKCVGAKVRALTILGGCRAEMPCEDSTDSRQRMFFLLITLLLKPLCSCVSQSYGDAVSVFRLRLGR